MKKYMLCRYHKRRDIAIKKLGGCCKRCGSKDDLHLDHIDPKIKSFYIAKLWSVKEESFWREIDKCQLLCQKCHVKKTIVERGMVSARGTHGTLSSHRYCKCDECKEAYNKYMREWKRNKRKNDKIQKELENVGR